MVDIDLNFEVAACYEELIDHFFGDEFSEFALDSGRGAGKTKLLCQLSVYCVMLLGCVVWSRQSYNTLRDSVYQDLVDTIEDMGLGEYFDYKYSPLMIKCKLSGYAIQFKGLKDFQRIKGLKPYKDRFVLYVSEETQELPNESFTAELIATIVKGKSEKCKIFYLFNPPPNKNHWVNKNLRDTIPGYRYHLHTCYTDLPPEWIGRKFIEDAERLKETNNKLYRYRYLGEAISSEDAIFENLKIREISEESISEWIREDVGLFVGLDFGYKPDPNAANMMYYDTDSRVLYIFKEFEQGELNNQQISDGLYAAGFLPDYIITADNVDKDIADLNSFGWQVRPAIKGPGSREKGFKWLCGLSQIVIDPVRCPKTANEFESYVYKANKEGELVGLFPEGQKDHHIAAVRYAMESVWRRKGM